MSQRIRIQILRVTTANRTSYTPASGEFLFETDTTNLYIGDGTTAGGTLIAGPSSSISSAANVGAGGVGLFKEITSGEIRFKNINAGSSKISVTNDVANDEVDVDLNEGSVDHDALQNYVAEEHVDHTTVILTAGTGLSGGGDITLSRTFDLEDTAVTPGTYADNNSVAQITVDQQGRITAVALVDIDHDALQNYEADEHRVQDDATTTTTNVWSASKIQTELDTKQDANLALNTQTGNYTIIAGDASSKILMNNAAAATVTLPNGFAVGFQVVISRIAAGIVTIAADGTLLSQGTQLDLINTGCVATHIGSNQWLVEGRLV